MNNPQYLSLAMILAFLQVSGQNLNDPKKIDIVLETAESYLETPYRWGGNGYSGIDCSGLTYQAFKKAGINIPRTSKLQSRHYPGKAVHTAEQLKRGDLVFFSMGNSRNINHVGIVSGVYSGRVRFLHSSSTNDGVYFNYLSGRWKEGFRWGKRLFKEGETRSGGTSEGFLPTGKYPQGSIKRLFYSDIKGMSPCEIKVMKNEIFARKGYIFHKNPWMVDYFENKDWYMKIEGVSKMQAIFLITGYPG